MAIFRLLVALEIKIIKTAGWMHDILYYLRKFFSKQEIAKIGHCFFVIRIDGDKNMPFLRFIFIARMGVFSKSFVEKGRNNLQVIIALFFAPTFNSKTCIENMSVGFIKRFNKNKIYLFVILLNKLGEQFDIG